MAEATPNTQQREIRESKIKALNTYFTPATNALCFPTGFSDLREKRIRVGLGTQPFAHPAGHFTLLAG